jgi:hypothetical protein
MARILDYVGEYVKCNVAYIWAMLHLAYLTPREWRYCNKAMQHIELSTVFVLSINAPVIVLDKYFQYDADNFI